MKKLLLLCVLLGYSVLSIAQSYREVVYLKNGSVIKGLIVEQVPSESLKIQTSDGSLFVFQMDEVAKITKEEIGQVQSPKQEKIELAEIQEKKPIEYKKKGYRAFIEPGFGFGLEDDRDGLIFVQTSHGYQFNPYFYFGGGMGLNIYFDNSPRVPVFANFRVNILNKRTTPFVDLKVGVALFDGFYFSPTIGVSRKLGRKVILSFGASYMMQMTDGEYDDDYYYRNYGSQIIGSIAFRSSISF